MGSISRSFALVLVIIFLILLGTPIAKADTSNDSNINCKLTTTSPDSKTVYMATMPLNINMAWTVSTVVPFMYFNVSYSFDDSQKISVAQGNNPSFNSTAQGTELHFEYVVYPPSTTNTVANIDISSLTSGAHKLTIFADGEYNLDNDFINPYHFASSPIYFSVNYLASYPTASPSPTETSKPTPMPTSTPVQTPTSSVPELSWLVILPLLAVLLSTTLFRKRLQSKHDEQN